MASTHEEISEAIKGTGTERPHTSLAEGPPGPAGPRPSSRRRRSLLLWAGAVAGLALGGYLLAPTVETMVNTISTDDAYVNGHVTYVAPRVAGQVSRVLVEDNQRVKKGDLLVELDKEPYRVQVAIKQAAVRAAEADLTAAEAQVRGLEAIGASQRWQLQSAMDQVANQIAGLRVAVARWKEAQAAERLARTEAERYVELARRKSVTQEQADVRQTDYEQAQARVRQALEQIHSIRAALALPEEPAPGHELTEVPADLAETNSAVRTALYALVHTTTQVGLPMAATEVTPRQFLADLRKQRAHGDLDRILKEIIPNAPAVKQAQTKLIQARADLDQALLDLRYCDIVSEIDGVVTSRNVNPGNNVSKGQGLMAVRSLTEIWVDANFKETQLADLRIGQRVRCEVDMYGGRHEFAGRITGFTMGTGQTLSLLPPQNATGNYVKIVQRLPVRIELTDYDPEKVPLFVGLSVAPYVYYKEPPTGPNAGAVLQPLAPRPTGPTAPMPSPASGARHE